jgi:hypothetical protein
MAAYGENLMTTHIPASGMRAEAVKYARIVRKRQWERGFRFVGAMRGPMDLRNTLYRGTFRDVSGRFQVLHRGLDVGVAHPLLHAADVGLRDHPRPEHVSQIVKSHRSQPGSVQRCLEPPTHRRAVQVAAGVADEHKVVVSDQLLSAAELRQRWATPGAIGTERTLPDFGVVSVPSA